MACAGCERRRKAAAKKAKEVWDAVKEKRIDAIEAAKRMHRLRRNKL